MGLWIQKEENINKHYKKPITYKVKKEYIKFLLDEIKKNKIITLQELNKNLKNLW